MTSRRLANERKRLDDMLKKWQRADIALAIIVAKQALLWADDAQAGYIAPSRFIDFASTLKQPHRSLHPTEQRRSTTRGR